MTQRPFQLGDFMDREPQPRLRPWLLLVIVGVVVVWQVVDPMPGHLVVRYVVLGIVVGVLWAPRLLPLTLVGLATFLIAHNEIIEWARRQAVENGQSWEGGWTFQSLCLAWALVGLIVSAPRVLRRPERSQDTVP